MRLHHSTTYVDSAYYYSRRSVVCRSVCCELCKNGCTDRDVVWDEDCPRNHLLDRSMQIPPREGVHNGVGCGGVVHCAATQSGQLSLLIHHRGAEMIASTSDI